MELNQIGLLLLFCAPFLAVFIGLGVAANARGTRQIDWSLEHDHWRNMDYLSWRRWVKAQGSVQPLPHARFFGRYDSCFAFEHGATLYESLSPLPHCGSALAPLIVTPYGVPVSEGWSVKDCFGEVRQAGRGSLCVTARTIVFDGVSEKFEIPLEDVHTVVASCSGILIGAESVAAPLLFTDVNGQRLRDVIAFLREV